MMSDQKGSKQNTLVMFTAVATTTAVIYYSSTAWMMRNKRRRKLEAAAAAAASSGGYESLIGNTPLVRLEKLSCLLKREIYVKMESLNPGGTGKDRAALAMIRDAISTNANHNATVTTVVEGTSGSTGISLASLCASRGMNCVIYMPDDQAQEKQNILRCLGATVHIVPNCAISNPDHYVNKARKHAEQLNLNNNNHHRNKIKKEMAVFMNQFENEANFQAHYTTTGPEIYHQMLELEHAHKHKDTASIKAPLHAFVMSSGTGGTLSGVGSFLKERMPSVKIVLADPPGSSLYHKIKHGVAFTEQQRERSLRRHRYDTIAEGVGLDRVTRNFALGCHDGTGTTRVIDDAVRVTDQEMVDMAHWLLREEGMFVGSSSAMNVVAAVRVAHGLQPGSRVVTVLCDGGQRHLTRFWNRDFIVDRGLRWPKDDRCCRHDDDDDGNGNDRHLPDCIAESLQGRDCS